MDGRYCSGYLTWNGAGDAGDEPEISDVMNSEETEEIFSNDVGDENTEVSAKLTQCVVS